MNAPAPLALEPLFDHSSEPEYLTDDFEVDEDVAGAVETHARDLVVALRNLMPPGLVEDTVPKMQFFDEWGNDFAEYNMGVELTGPADAKLSNDRWHAGNGYLIEMLQVIPLKTTEDGRTYTDMRFRAFRTALDNDPLELLRDWPDEANPEVDGLLKSVNRNLLDDATTVLLDVQYYHETEADE